jgi:hypothetical protein
MMKRTENMAIMFVLLLILPVMLLVGCGNHDRKDEAAAMCPSGTYYASATDKLTSGTLNAASVYVHSGSQGATIGLEYLPEPSITVTDADGNPRNKICVIFTTGGQWWTDSSKSTELKGTGSNNTIALATNDHGIITLNWTTGPLPLSSAATSTIANGPDFTVQPPRLIGASSGLLSALMTANITVLGCPASTFGTGSCP